MSIIKWKQRQRELLSEAIPEEHPMAPHGSKTKPTWTEFVEFVGSLPVDEEDENYFKGKAPKEDSDSDVDDGKSDDSAEAEDSGSDADDIDSADTDLEDDGVHENDDLTDATSISSTDSMLKYLKPGLFEKKIL